MTESDLRDFGAATRACVSDGFTAAVFAGVGVDRYARAASELGEVFVAWNATGVSAIRLADADDAFEAWYRQRFGRTAVPAVEDDAICAAARAALRGDGDAADVPLDLRACSPFERRVLEKAAEIGRGHARPYNWVAREIGTPDATRAVGNALAHNPVPLLIPCHRVIRGDVSFGGYVFGAGAKRALLEREGLDVGVLESLARRGVRYIGNEDGTFCLPTCGDVATHADEPGYVGLRSLTEAHAHGLQPCSQCRPAAAA
ncbi:MAG TPA: methylated-DNA--[protein]-cysteine S-methyltransferase [Candidatus Elarobacter sp.]|jgi:methylated-DNA-[protein]-cysteine S-methyltransferase|nr:methylated-DNA--[protein]-cysteine S-methyltransferase [Candidatus Elarobacter sp.]